MTAPSLWVTAWHLISCAETALTAHARPLPGTREVGSGGIDSLCCDAIFANITAGGRAELRDACNPRVSGVIQLYLVRPCVARGIDPETPSRAFDPGEPPNSFDPWTWIPPAGTWHHDQFGLLQDLDALLPAMATVTATDRYGLPGGGPQAQLTSWAPYLTGAQGSCQGWLLTYRPFIT